MSGEIFAYADLRGLVWLGEVGSGLVWHGWVGCGMARHGMGRTRW